VFIRSATERGRKGEKRADIPPLPREKEECGPTIGEDRSAALLFSEGWGGKISLVYRAKKARCAAREKGAKKKGNPSVATLVTTCRASGRKKKEKEKEERFVTCLPTYDVDRRRDELRYKNRRGEPPSAITATTSLEKRVEKRNNSSCRIQLPLFSTLER